MILPFIKEGRFISVPFLSSVIFFAMWREGGREGRKEGRQAGRHQWFTPVILTT
jgi:hypothetical protein